jgi:O-antigen biosynthesis protein
MRPIEPTNAPLVNGRPAPYEGAENAQRRRGRRGRTNGATQLVPAHAQPETRTGRVRLDGKFFAIGSQRFDMRGVTYGTFAPRADGALFPELPRLKRDLQAMRAAGFNVVRTYTAPPEDLLECAAEEGLRVLAGLFYPDWRYVLGGSRREHRRIARQAAQTVRAEAQRLAGRDEVMAMALGNEVPADVLRWYGSGAIAQTLRELADVVREEDADQLVTYANYPTAEYLPLEQLDFLVFNVFLERRVEFRRYLTRLHHLAGDRPLVLGEVGFSGEPTPDGEQGQAQMLDWQLETAVERGVAGMCVFSWTDEWNVGGKAVTGWQFGLTRADRSSRPALDVASRWNRRTVRDLGFRWPSLSVVVCAHDAAATMDECLRHTCALDYPRLEVIVVDDGSTDDTAAIARRHPRVRLVKLERNMGLAEARNAGIEEARGDLVAYLDADAAPPPEWPYYLALGLDAKDVGGSGGPNLPRGEDPTGAHVVARAPGGPVHVLTEDDRAEHIPGCNMAFWKIVLVEVGGFDPVYRSAGDDVDLCWKVLDRRWKIGFHPAAMVWHHRRPGLGAYLRQQRGYGRSEALVEARHPERFTPTGTARWRGRIYNPALPRVIGRQRVYRGVYGTAPYQSIYQAGGHTVDLLHQVGIPLAAILAPTASLAVFHRWLALPAVLAALGVLALFLCDVAQTDPPRRMTTGRLRFRVSVALHCLLQPLVRWWARSRHRHEAMRGVAAQVNLPCSVRQLAGGVVVVLEDRPRAELAAGLIAAVRSRGVRATRPSPWQDCDAGMMLSGSVRGELQTSSHPEGFVQIRIRPRPRPRFLIATLSLVAVGVYVTPFGALLILVPVTSAVRGALRARRLPARLLRPAEPA